jgi:hypothetical protein
VSGCLCAKGRWNPACPVHPSNVIPFPTGQAEVVAAPGGVQWSIVAGLCSGLVHVYPEVPGRCQCGDCWWDG